MHIKSQGKAVIIEPVEPVADRYFGAFKVTDWPKDLDEYAVEVKKRWRKKDNT
jgi:hypothetical protein